MSECFPEGEFDYVIVGAGMSDYHLRIFDAALMTVLQLLTSLTVSLNMRSEQCVFYARTLDKS
jgi:hypothetical protein